MKQALLWARGKCCQIPRRAVFPTCSPTRSAAPCGWYCSTLLCLNFGRACFAKLRFLGPVASRKTGWSSFTSNLTKGFPTSPRPCLLVSFIVNIPHRKSHLRKPFPASRKTRFVAPQIPRHLSCPSFSHFTSQLTSINADACHLHLSNISPPAPQQAYISLISLPHPFSELRVRSTYHF